jgi:hypothetical protein
MNAGSNGTAKREKSQWENLGGAEMPFLPSKPSDKDERPAMMGHPGWFAPLTTDF